LNPRFVEGTAERELYASAAAEDVVVVR
jgi:hypothetical protein